MRRTTWFMTFIAAIVLWTTTAFAGTAKMLFWYPGEAGSTVEAKPVLDAFFAYVNQKIAPETISGSYFNTVEGGVGFLTKEKPAVAIVSFAALTQNKEKLASAQPILATLPLPQGTATVQYALVGVRTTVNPGEKLLASEPLTPAFVRTHLFPNLAADISIKQDAQLLMQLKKMADGQLDAIAILTPAEANSLASVSAAWAQKLKVITKSSPVPSARVLLLSPTWKGAEKFKNALQNASTDPAAKDILGEMQVKGFAVLP